jgi:hypothetical protein
MNLRGGCEERFEETMSGIGVYLHFNFKLRWRYTPINERDRHKSPSLSGLCALGGKSLPTARETS